MKIFNHLNSRFERYDLRNVISKIGAYKAIEGWLTEYEAYGLYSIARKIKNDGIIVEIGSWKGKSTYCLARGSKKAKVYAIDPFNGEGEPGSKEIYEQTKGENPLIEQFTFTMRKLGVLHNITPLIGFSNQFVNNFNEIDFLFIDGDHSIEGCDYDYKSFSPLVKVGGYIAFHDYDLERNDLGPTWVINNRLGESDFKFYKKFDSLWVARRQF
jgi:MMP 1-O-methyltransferase